MKAILILVAVGYLANGCAGIPTPAKPATDGGITRAYLVAHGFVESKDSPGIFSLANVRIGEAARNLGFSLADLRPTPSQPPGSDIRTVPIRNLHFVLYARTTQLDGRTVADSLNDPNSICTIRVALEQVPPERDMHKKGPSTQRTVASGGITPTSVKNTHPEKENK